MSSSVLHRLRVGLAAPAALALGLAACGGDGDVSKEDLSSELQEGGDLSEAEATCVTDRVFDELDQDQINELYTSNDDDEALDAETSQLFTTIGVECAEGG
ncbi:MAG TPA: hypothetical protein VGO60_14130 [Iamia sp.]|jgi:hypothetical protein|nr:hypothetical protein [Iamia sp.]